MTTKTERNNRILVMRLSHGFRYSVIAQLFDISATRARQIVERHLQRERRIILHGNRESGLLLRSSVMYGERANPPTPQPPMSIVAREIVLADIAYLKQKEIDNGDRAKWLKSQRDLGYIPSEDRLSIGRDYGVITEAMFHYRVGRPPVRDELDRCNCKMAGHRGCGWCNGCQMPKSMCECDRI